MNLSQTNKTQIIPKSAYRPSFASQRSISFSKALSTTFQPVKLTTPEQDQQDRDQWWEKHKNDARFKTEKSTSNLYDLNAKKAQENQKRAEKEMRAKGGPVGQIKQVIGAVVDVQFPSGKIPGIYNALEGKLSMAF